MIKGSRRGEKNVRLSILALAGLTCLILTGCRLKDHEEWDMNVRTPLAYTEMSIRDLINDTILKTSAADQSLSVVYVQNLARMRSDTFLKVPDTVLQKNVSLKTLQLGERVIQRNITLGEVARAAGFTGQVILLNQGKSMVIPPLYNLTTGDVAISAQNFFQSATFIEGKLKIDIHNGFPVDLTNIHYELRNAQSSKVIIDDTINIIQKGGSFSRIYPLNGKTVEGKMVANIISMNSPGSYGQSVPIDTNAALSIRLVAYDMHVLEATAIFPAQYVVNDSIDITYDLKGAKFNFFRIKKGQIRIRTAHTMPDSLYLYYTIPGAKRNGNPLSIYRVVPPAPPGDTSDVSETYPVDGYDVDLTGKHRDTFNTFFNILRVRIDSTGKMEKLSLKDSIYIYYGLFNVVPEYAHGYLGQSVNMIGPATTKFDFLSRVVNGNIDLEDAVVNLDLTNGVGAEARVKVISLKAMNTRNGTSKQLSGLVVNEPYTVQPATDNPFKPTHTIIRLDKTNSNIKDLLNMLPDQFEYQVEVSINPNGNTSNYNDFLYSSSEITADLDIETPLHLGINGLTLQDTLSLNLSSNKDMDRVMDGTLYLLAENTFPFTGTIQVYMADRQNNILDSLLKPGQDKILAGIMDPTEKRVYKATSSRISIPLSESKWQKLRGADHLLIRTRYDSYPGGERVKIFSNYKMKVKLSADFRYRNAY